MPAVTGPSDPHCRGIRRMHMNKGTAFLERAQEGGALIHVRMAHCCAQKDRDLHPGPKSLSAVIILLQK